MKNIGGGSIDRQIGANVMDQNRSLGVVKEGEEGGAAPASPGASREPPAEPRGPRHSSPVPAAAPAAPSGPALLRVAPRFVRPFLAAKPVESAATRCLPEA